MNIDKEIPSYFYLRMTEFLIDNHPDRIDDTDLIQVRSETALEEFEKMSKDGHNVSECLSSSLKTMTEGLVFSPYKTIRHIVTEYFSEKISDSNIEENARNIFVMKMKDMCSDIFDRYPLEDTFEGSQEYSRMCTEIIGCITFYIEEHGIQ